MELSNLTRKRAEKIVKDFVREGTVRGEQAQERVEELLERSRKASEHLAGVVRTEVTRQMETLGLVQPVKKAARPAKTAAKKTTATAKKATATAKKAAKTTKAATKKATGQS